MLHYLDNFFICARDQTTCSRYMEVFFNICRQCGVPIAEDKTVGPEQTLTYLGIEIDAKNQIIRLPKDKLDALLALLKTWLHRKKCTRRELESLIGSLSFAAKVVKPGRLFLRRLIDLSTSVSSRNFFIDLNVDARADVKWWHDFITEWNGVEFFTKTFFTSHELQLFTDASGLGIGGVFCKAWFSTQLPDRLQTLHINVLALLAVVAAVFTWGVQWQDSAAKIFTDNYCIVQVWARGSSKDRHIMSLLRALFFFCAQHNIHLHFAHLPGKQNMYADALSRLQVTKFKRMHPEAEAESTCVPEIIWDIL